jgi:hypothetical protein
MNFSRGEATPHRNCKIEQTSRGGVAYSCILDSLYVVSGCFGGLGGYRMVSDTR